jgi:hypothetical protein
VREATVVVSIGTGENDLVPVARMATATATEVVAKIAAEEIPLAAAAVVEDRLGEDSRIAVTIVIVTTVTETAGLGISTAETIRTIQIPQTAVAAKAAVVGTALGEAHSEADDPHVEDIRHEGGTTRPPTTRTRTMASLSWSESC